MEALDGLEPVYFTPDRRFQAKPDLEESGAETVQAAC